MPFLEPEERWENVTSLLQEVMRANQWGWLDRVKIHPVILGGQTFYMWNTFCRFIFPLCYLRTNCFVSCLHHHHQCEYSSSCSPLQLMRCHVSVLLRHSSLGIYHQNISQSHFGLSRKSARCKHTLPIKCFERSLLFSRRPHLFDQNYILFEYILNVINKIL